MNRRTFVGRSLASAALGVFTVANASTRRAGAQVQTTTRLPAREGVRVAFLLGESANVIDTAGPWEVFQDVHLHNAANHNPFELYTVAETTRPLQMTGGLQVQPKYSIEDAPQPHVIVVPAQRATDATRAWLRKASANTDVTMSVCTGAFQLARAGLLDGVVATTHHDYWDAFAKEFPKIELRRGLRFVDNGRIATAGGLTSGIDMALHIVSRYYGVEAAEATATYMEYSSDAWRVKA